MFGGFASPRPGNPTLIAFAGQPALSYWGQTPPDPLPDPLPTPAYNQDDNYIFLNRYVGGVYSSAPLEPGASIATFDSAYQGRAPSWSPDGNHLVFESSRAGGYALFRITSYNVCYTKLLRIVLPSGRNLPCCAQ